MLFYNSKTLCSPVIYISSFTWWINQFFLMQNRNAQSVFPVFWYPPRLVKCSHLSRLESDIPQSIYGIILSSYTQISTDVFLLIWICIYSLRTHRCKENEQSSLIAATDRVQHVTEQSPHCRDAPQIELKSADQRQINN